MVCAGGERRQHLCLHARKRKTVALSSLSSLSPLDRRRVAHQISHHRALARRHRLLHGGDGGPRLRVQLLGRVGRGGRGGRLCRLIRFLPGRAEDFQLALGLRLGSAQAVGFGCG